MNGVQEWLINLPRYFADLGAWLTKDFHIGTLTITPLAALGVGLGVFLAVVVALKIKSLILA